MKKSALIFALIVGLLTSASTAMAQTVNMSRYITLTVENGEAIRLDFLAAADGTPVRIVSGSNTQDITAGTDWKGTASYTAGSTTMKVYGDIISFDCSSNITKVTAIDVSKNTQLKTLYCSYNTLSSLDVSHNTQLTMLNCSNNSLNSLDISQNTQLTKLYCYDNQLTSLDVSKNTQLEMLDCSHNNLNSLDVSKNTQLKELSCYSNSLSNLDVSNNTQLTKLSCYDNQLSTAALDSIYCALPDRTGVEAGKIVPIVNASSSNAAIVKATTKSNATSKNWKVQYAAGDDIFATTGTYVCGSSSQPNMDSYITLTVAKDSAIWLDFKAAAAGTPVRIVSGSNTQDITVGTNWKGFAKYTADGTEMKVYGDLTGFNCFQNGANLTALDLSHNTRLEKLYCYGNNFTTTALDDIFCTLPDRIGKGNGEIQPVKNSSDPNHATVLATNKQNAITKNWKVQYYQNDADIPATTGKHKCSATDIADASAEQALTLYPNPVADVLYLSATARTIRVYNIYGVEVAHATDTDRIDVAHLPAGVYTVKADGTVAKMVKR